MNVVSLWPLKSMDLTSQRPNKDNTEDSKTLVPDATKVAAVYCLKRRIGFSGLYVVNDSDAPAPQ